MPCGSKLDRTQAMTRGCAIGIDPGERWIGVARAPRGSSLALPLGTLDRTAGESAVIDSLKTLLGDDVVEHMIVGVPLRPDGGEDEQAVRFRDFGETLAAALGATCIAQNERFSSKEPAAESRNASEKPDRSSGRKVRAAGRKSVQRQRRERQRSHAEAAARILQRWLDAQAGAAAGAARERPDRED